MIDPRSADRLLVVSSGLVYSPPIQELPEDVAKRLTHWLRTDTPGLIPYVGAGGDERDVRQWAWLAFLRKAQVIQWSGTLPRQTRPDEPADPYGLTVREREILALLAEGRTNRQIGETLFISPSTAGVHVSNILGKLGATSRAEAAGIAVRLGLGPA